MSRFNLKPSHKIIKNFYQEIAALSDLKISTEGVVAPAFANLLRHCASQCDLQLVEQYPLNRDGKHPIRTDGAIFVHLNCDMAFGSLRIFRIFHALAVNLIPCLDFIEKNAVLPLLHLQ